LRGGEKATLLALDTLVYGRGHGRR